MALEKLWQRTRHLGKGLVAHNALSHASAMAFQFFLSLVPLLALVGYVLGHLVRARGIEALMAPVFELFPPDASKLVREQLEGLGGSVSAPAAPVAVVGFLFVATTGTHHLMDVFEVMVGAARRPWWTQRLVALVWLGAVALVFAGIGWLLLKCDASLHADEIAVLRAARKAAALAHEPKPHLPRVHHAAWERVVTLLAFGLVALVSLAALYRVAVVHPDVRRRVWPGAALALAVGFVVSYAFAAYAGTVSTYTAYYGGLAAVAVVLVWLYLTSLALLAGAELNAQLEGVRQIAATPAPRARTSAAPARV